MNKEPVLKNTNIIVSCIFCLHVVLQANLRKVPSLIPVLPLVLQV